MIPYRTAVALAILLVPLVAHAQSLAVHVGQTTQKMNPLTDTTTVGLPTSASISAARNEFEGFEIFLFNTSFSANVTNIDVTATALTRVGGTETIPASNIWIYREAYLFIGGSISNNEILAVTGVDPRNRFWPDPLVPRVDEMYSQYRGGFQNFGPKDPTQVAACPIPPTPGTFSSCNYIPPRENRAIFVDILVPLTQPGGAITPAGTYQGNITVSSSSGSVPVQVSVNVWNFELDSTAALRTYYNMSIGQAGRAHLGSSDPGTVSTYNSFLALYGRYLLDHRISSDVVHFRTMTYQPGGQPGAPYWSNFENLFGEFFNGVTDPKSRLKGARMTTIPYSWDSATGACNDVDQHRQWEEEFKARGWWSRTFNKHMEGLKNTPGTCWFDEPTPIDWQNIRTYAQRIHGNAATQDFLLMATSDPKDAQPNNPNYTMDVDLLVSVMHRMYNKSPDENGALNPVPNYAGDQRSNYAPTYSNKLWWYQGCYSAGCAAPGDPGPKYWIGNLNTNESRFFQGWPSYNVDVLTAAENRAMEWLSARYRIVGEHYFDVMHGLSTAWRGVYDFGGNGDGTLVYPGTVASQSDALRFTVGIGGNDDVPISSLRLKMLRDGIEDFEYLTKVQGIDAVFADNTVDDLFGVARGTLPPPYRAGTISMAAMNDKRAALANRLVGAPPVPLLSVQKVGAGTGTVTSSPAGISCGATCSKDFAAGTTVTLSATADSGSTFGGFTGGSCSGGQSCTIVLNSSVTVTATFNGICTVSDCFNRPDSPNLGANWNTYDPALEIFSGQARNANVGSKASQFSQSVGTDHEVTVSCLVTGSGSNCGLMGRWSDANNHYYGFLDPGLGAIHLYRVQGGIVTHLGGANRTMNFSTYYKLRLLIQGSSLSLYFDSEPTPAISLTDTALTNGSYGGLHAYGGSAQAVWYKNFNMVAATPTNVAFRAASTSSYPSGGTQTLTASVPAGTQAGDLLVAMVGFGNSAAMVLPTIAPPSGWTMVRRVDHGVVNSLAAYWHVAASGENSYTWTTDQWVGGVLSIMAYSGVSTVTPIDVSNGVDNSVLAYSYSTPSVTTTTPGDVLIATIFAHSDPGTPPTWTTPPGTVMRSTANNGGSRSIFSSDVTQASPGASSAYTFTASNLQTHAITHVLALKPSSPPAPPPPSIAWRASSTLSVGISTTTLTISKPTGTASGDVLVAAVAMGDSTNTVQPTFTPPAGWALVRRVDRDTSNALAMYWRVAGATEPASYVWTSSAPVKGIAWISAYSGVDNSTPIHAEMGQENAVSATQYSTPSINITVPNTMIVASFAGYQAAGTDTSWTAPPPTNQRANLSTGFSRSGTGTDVPQTSAPAIVSMSATASVAQTYAMTHVLALKPAP